MKGLNIGLGIVIASFAFAAAPAFAQPRDTGGGPQAAGAVDRGSGGGATSSGGAVDRGSGGGGGSVSSAGGGGSTSSASGSSSDFARSTPSAVSSPSISMGDRGAREFAPRHREGFTSGSSGFSFRDDSAQATPRSSGPSGGSGGGGTAVTRGGGTSSSGSSGSSGGGSSASGSSDGARTPSRTRTGPAAEVNAGSSNNVSGAREVPSWSRPRGDRPVSGTAVERTVPPPDRDGGYRGRYGYYDPFYGYGYGGYYGYGYGFGYGCGLSCGYYPYGFGMGYGLYSGFPYYGDPFGDPSGGYAGSGGYTTSYGRGEQGNLKLKVKPRSAKVYVDGYFVGYVDQFDGSFQKLALNTGRHKVEVKAEGYETAEFDVLINPEQTVTFQGDLKRIQ